MSTVTFARGAAAPKASAKGGIGQAIVGAITGGAGGGSLNGTVNGKKGFQPGNKYGANRKGGSSPAVKASGVHRSARAVVSKHLKAGTIATPEGRAAVRTAAAAHRELQAARSQVVSAKSGEAKATRAVASGRASALPKPGETKPATTTPTVVTKPTNRDAVAKGAKEASAVKTERATTHLGDLHAGAKAGAVKPTDIHGHVERIAKGVTHPELKAVAEKAGIDTKGLKTKGQLVERIKEHAHGLTKPDAAKANPEHALKDFADRAVAAAHASPTGGFGNEKTFISHAKAHLDKTDPEIARMSDAEFKAKLVEANTAGHLSLGRGDMVASMHPGDVAASSTPHLNVDYHFIRHPEAPGKGQSTPPPAPAAKATPKAAKPKPVSASQAKVDAAAAKIREHIGSDKAIDNHTNKYNEHPEVDRVLSGLTQKQADRVGSQFGFPKPTADLPGHHAIREQVKAAVKARAKVEHKPETAAAKPTLKDSLARAASNTTAQKAAIESHLDAATKVAPVHIENKDFGLSEPMHSIEHEGIKYHFSASPEGRVLAASALHRLHSSEPIPSHITAHTKEVHITTADHPKNKNLAAELGPDYANGRIRGYAQGGKVGMYSTKNYGVDEHARLAHEMSHNYAKHLYGSMTPKEGSDFHKATQTGEKPYSNYGATSLKEDFATSFTGYHTHKEAFAKRHPERFKVIDRLHRESSYGG